MNAHTPFDAKKDWSNPYCQNSSNDQIVDSLLGNAYHVVRTVYCNLGNLKSLYDFLDQYGMVIGVNSEEELKALSTQVKYSRIYGFSRAGDRQVTDYLYVEGDRTGILPNDTTATGSWITVATSGSSGGGGGTSSGEGAYIPWVYSNGSAIGGETTINVPDGTVGVPFIIVNGDMQYIGRGFEFNVDSLSVTLAQPLEEGDEVVFLLTGVPAVPDNPNVNDWVQINWLYNNGAAVGGEQVIAVPYTFQSVPAVYKNGLRLYKGLTTESYTADPDNQRILLTEPLSTNDRLIVQIGGEAQVLEASDHTLQEVARAANVKDTEVILSTDTTTYLNDKVVIYVTGQQKSYKLPTLPTNVRIGSVTGDQLTYVPGNVVVTLIPITSDDLAGSDGAQYVGACSSVAQLRTVVPTTNGQRIALSGYYVGYEYNIPVMYTWNSASTAADDGGRIIAATGITTGRWFLEQSGNVFDARLFGLRPATAYSAGMPDSATMFAKAQASVGTNGVIHFPLPDGWTSAHYLINADYSYNWAQSWISADPGVVIHNGATNDDEGKKPRLKSDVVFNQTTPTSTSTYTTERGSNSYDLKAGISAAMAAAGLNIYNKEVPISFTEYCRSIRIDNTNLTYSDFSTGMTITADQISWSNATSAGTAWHGVEMAAADGVEIETSIQNRQAITSGVVMAGVRAMTSGSTGAGGIISLRLTIGDPEARFYNGDTLVKTVTQYHPADWINSSDNGAVRIAVRISNNGKAITWLINGSPVYTYTTGSTYVHTIVFAADQAARSGVTFQFAYSRVRDFVQYAKPVRIGCLGDSITRGARTSNEWPRLLEAYGEHMPGVGRIRSVDNLAVSGWRSQDIVNNLANYDFTKYDYVLILIGTNDCQAVLPTGANHAMTVLANNITTIGNAIVAANPQCIPIFGMFYKWTNPANSGGGNQTFNLQYIANFQSTLRWIAQGNGWDVAFVDDHFGENYGYIGSFPPSGLSPFWTNDNLHPNTRGDLAVAAAFASALSRKMSAPTRGAYCRMVPLINGFTKREEATYGVMKVSKTGNAVTISGAIKDGAANTIFGSLPVWARPEEYRVFSVLTTDNTTDSTARLVVQPDGNIFIGSGYKTGGAFINVTFNV